FSNFDHNIFKGKVALMLNPLNCRISETLEKKIENILGIKSEDLYLPIWFPISTFGKEFYSQTLKLNCLKEILEILEEEIELLNEDEKLKELRRMGLKNFTKIIQQKYQN
ncbi:MAG: hypothetical protein ACRCZO_06245, partial [Cetobacterium sp.]